MFYRWSYRTLMYRPHNRTDNFTVVNHKITYIIN